MTFAAAHGFYRDVHCRGSLFDPSPVDVDSMLMVFPVVVWFFIRPALRLCTISA